MGTDDPNNPDQEEPPKEEGSEPGDVKDGKVFEVIIPTLKEKDSSQQKPSAQQAATASDVYGCPYDYDYDEEFDTCVPTEGSFAFWPVIAGDEPWPDSPGGYLGLAGGFVQDSATAVGVGLQIGLGHYVGDTLVDFGEGGGPIGWGIQGLGYTLGFTGDAAGVLVEGAGQVVGAVADGVGEVIDDIGSAAGDAWDEVSSWF